MEEPAEPAQATSSSRRTSMATVGNLERAMRGVRRVAFSPESSVEGDPRVDSAGLEEVVRSSLTAMFESRGYGQAPVDRADRLISYTVLLDTSADDVEMTRRFGFSPGVGAGPGGAYERGTIVVMLIHPGLGEPVWRGAVQALPDFDAPVEVREERVRRSLWGLLSKLPEVE